MGAALLAGPHIGGAAGGLFGGAAGLIQGFAQKKSAAKLPYAIRRGMTMGEEEAARQTAGVLTSAEYQGGASWLRGLFDLGGYGYDQALSDLKFAAGGAYAGFDPHGGTYGSGRRGVQLRNEMYRRSEAGGGPVGAFVGEMQDRPADADVIPIFQFDATGDAFAIYICPVGAIQVVNGDAFFYVVPQNFRVLA